MRAGAALLCLGFIVVYPREAWVSGSSEVELRSRHFAVRFESVRKIIRDADDEARWHAEWRARARERLAEVQAALEARMPALAKDRRLRLARYDEAYPEVCASPPEQPPTGPVRCQFDVPRPFGLTIIVAFRRLPSEEARQALGEKLAEIVAPLAAP